MNLKRKQCKIIAHRGFSGIAPENTISAFELAGKADFYGIESDIQTTKDNQFLMFHDETLDRMTGVTGVIKDLTYEAIKKTKINAGSNIENYPNLSIPLLNDYLETCVNYQVKPIVEIKYVNSEANLDQIINRIKFYNLYKESTIISFNKDYLIYLRKKYFDLKIQYLVNQIDLDVISSCKMYRFDVDTNYGCVTKDIVDLCHQEGILINVWTVDDPSMAQLLIDYGVDFITTNLLK